MSVRKFGKSWYVDVSWRGKRHRLRSPDNTIAGARCLEQRVRRALADDGDLKELDPAERASEPTFAEFAERWLVEKVDPRNRPMERATKRFVLRRHLLPAFGARALKEIRADDLARLALTLLGSGLTAKTANNYVGILRACLAYAHWCELIPRVPRYDKLPVPDPRERQLSEMQIEAILRASEGPLLRQMILFAVNTGLRFSELSALRWSDIVPDPSHSDRFAARIQRTLVRGELGRTKTDEPRTLPLNAGAVAVLRERSRETEHVFTCAGAPVSYLTAYRWLAIACARAGLPSVGWHALRHTFASNVLSAGATKDLVRDLLGHSTTVMTDIYAHHASPILHDAVRRLDREEQGPPAGKERAPRPRA
jgi:integrase